MLNNTKEFWSTVWAKHHDAYIKAIPRQAYYVYFISKKNDKNALEIAAGSFRDVMRLNEWGFNCIGIDFSEKAIQLARKTYNDFQNKFYVMKAEKLDFDDKFFDISFHNGFFICFQDNFSIKQLIKEQVRVTKRAVICTVHNKLNKDLFDQFNKKAKVDKLYDIRWFDCYELKQLLSPYVKNVEILPFGHPIFDKILYYLCDHKVLLKLLYIFTRRLWDLSKCERVMVIGYL